MKGGRANCGKELVCTCKISIKLCKGGGDIEMTGKLLILAVLLLALALAPIATAHDTPRWTIETVDSTDNVGAYTSLALDSSDKPHISYHNESDRSLKYARWTGSSWSIETVDSTDWAGFGSSLALDSSDKPHISYSGNKDLKYARWTGTEWANETVDSGFDAGFNEVDDISLALDSSDKPHISYCYIYWDTWTLKYAKRTGTEWANETVDSTDNVGEYTSLALDSSGNPHISYYDSTNRNLKYARWKKVGGYYQWSIETVDFVDDVEVSTSLALDSFNNPHISYYDSTNRNLKYARWTGSSWSIETVDSAGRLCSRTSLALDSSNNPRISYYDFTKGNLKYAFISAIPSIVTVQGKLTDSAGSPIQTGSMRITIKDFSGAQVWQNTVNNVFDDGVFNLPLGAQQELRLAPDSVYQMVIAIDVDSTYFVSADVTFGDGSPSGDVIKFTV